MNIKEQLKKIEIFSNIDEENLNQIADITTIKKLSRDQILFYEGDSPDNFYGLVDGSLKLYKTGIKANEIVLHYFTSATLVAEMATLENIKFPATSVATKDDTLIVIINKEKFLSMLQNNSAFSFSIVKSLTKKIKSLEVAINRNLIFDATSKVCSLLQEKPTIFKEQKNIQIANILNMAPETLSRVVTKLKKIEILDSDKELIDKDKLGLFLEF